PTCRSRRSTTRMCCWRPNGRARRSPANMAGQFDLSCRSSICGRAPSGCATSASWTGTLPASGKCAAITTMAIPGRRNDMAKKGLASFAGMLVAAAVSTVLPQSAPAATGTGSGFDFSFESIDGGALPLDQYRGRPVLVVNTASQCGFTPQYEGLQALWEKYRDRGLVVLGVPSNDFGGQEPGSIEEIKQFCEVSFGIDF